MLRHLRSRAFVTLVAVCGSTIAMSGTSYASGVTVTDLNKGATPNGLAQSLVGGGVSISNVTYTGDNRAAGTFTGGASSIGFDSGIVLSSGKVQTYPTDLPCSRGVEGPNNCYEATGGNPLGGPDGFDNSTAFGTPGDSALTAMSGFPTFDAAVLQFNFVPQQATIQFSYVFGSEEYSDFANTQFNDVLGLLVNGTSCAMVPGTTEPVSVNTINNGNDVGGDATPHNAQYFRDNVRPNGPTIASQFDGLTTVLTCTANVNAGQTNTLKLAVADASDAILDSGFFVEAGSLVSGTQITTSLAGGGQSGAQITVPTGTSVTDSSTLVGANASSAGGTVSYKVYSDSGCTSQFADGGTKTVSSGSVSSSDPVTFTQAGTYYWQASYSGDANNNPSKSACGAETVTVTAPVKQPTTLTTLLSGGSASGTQISVPAGTAVSDAPTLTGANVSKAGGSVTYSVYSDSACTMAAASPSTVTVTNGSVPNSSPVTLSAPGTYYWVASYSGDSTNGASSSSCGSETETVMAPGKPPVVDDSSNLTGSTSITDTQLTTSSPNDLVVAYVSADGPASGGQSVTVSGSGLAWTRVAQQNGALGDAEVWVANAGTNKKITVKVTAAKKRYGLVLTDATYKNATGIGAKGTFKSTSGAPTGMITTTQSNSWVWAVGFDWATATKRTVGPGQTLFSQNLDAANNTYWVQSTTSPTLAAGTNVTINDTAPTSDPYDLVLVEIL